MREPKQDPAYDLEIDVAKDALEAARKAEQEARQIKQAAKAELDRIYALAWGIKPGVRVLDHKGQEFAAASASFAFERPWVYGRKIKKNGEPGKAEQCLYGAWKFAE